MPELDPAARGHSYIKLRGGGAQPAPEDAVISYHELVELHALRRARESIIDWCDGNKGPAAIVIRRILDEADLRQRLSLAGLSVSAVDRTLAGESIAPGIHVLVDGFPLSKKDD